MPPKPTILTRQRRVSNRESGVDAVKNDTKPTNPKDIAAIAKVPQSVVPRQVLSEVAVALSEGAWKYGRHNYRKTGVLASVYYDATMRHLDDWWEGTDIDTLSGLSHITKAIASLFVMRDAMIQEMFTDDRPPKVIENHIERSNKQMEELFKRMGGIEKVAPVTDLSLSKELGRQEEPVRDIDTYTQDERPFHYLNQEDVGSGA